MDAFDFVEADKAASPRKATNLVWNILTILVLLTTLGAGIYFLMIFINPASTLNPFPPPTLPVAPEMPTATPTPRAMLPPTWTPTVTFLPSATPEPTFTPAPTDTPPVLPADTSQPNLTAEPGVTLTPGGFSFGVQQGSPQAILNIYYPDLGCNWMGIGGQALSLNDSPVIGLLVQMGGSLGGNPVDLTSMTGIATQYGRAGYEFYLANKPILSTASLWVQLLDQAGIPLSDKIYIDTFDSCEKNLIILNFKQVK